MRIVIVGQGPFGEKVLQAYLERGESVVGVFCPPDKRGDAMKALAESSGIFVSRPAIMKDLKVFRDYANLKPDLAVLAFVTDIIPENLLSVPSTGTICYHPSLLPRHRGASAINWAIIQGDTRTGLTIFWADKGIDTGPILLQKEVEIGPDDTTGSLYFNALFPMGVEALVEAVDWIKRGRAPKIPQDHASSTYEPPCDDRVASIDFEKTAAEIYNLIRGCDPQPGAYTTYRGRKVRFYAALMTDERAGAHPGEVIAIHEKGMDLVLRGGGVRIGKVRPDRGEKIDPLEFAGSAGLEVGDRFGS
jgi:methionyl-tRNA formyltransferase